MPRRAQTNLNLGEEATSLTPTDRSAPLAETLRPVDWSDFAGLERLDTNLIDRIRAGRGKPPSLILWGPPGVGKTTFAKLVGRSFHCNFVQFSAVLSGVKEIREVVVESRSSPEPTLLFVDEIHRFNKAQQDAFLPHVEDGTISLIGATTENPSFYLTSALLSRCKVVVLKDLEAWDLEKIATRASQSLSLEIAPDALGVFIETSGGDARKLLNLIESFRESFPEAKSISHKAALDFLKSAKVAFYDRSGEEHYNIVSAFIKSMRGSSPDAALYWGFRMIESGEDPRFVIRRMMIFASEDIGNADPRALQVAVACADAFDRLGLPEGKIPIAHAITYLATAPKSNRSYMAMHGAIAAVHKNPKISVPLHLRNAPTKLMKNLNYGEGYDYPHNHDEGYVAGVQYLPDSLKEEVFYHPTERGYEKNIKERQEILKTSSYATLPKKAP